MYSMASNYVKQRQKEKRRRSIYMPFKERPKDNQSKVNKINTYARKTFLPSFGTGHIKFGHLKKN